MPQWGALPASLPPVALVDSGIERASQLRDLAQDPVDLRPRADVDERELDPLLTPVTVDPAHPFPRVINKALCLGLLLRRRRRSALTYTGVVSVSAVDINKNRAPYSNFGTAISVGPVVAEV